MAEPYDRFGWAIATGDFGRGRQDDLAVGIPFDGRGDTGTVVVLYSHFYHGLRTRGTQLWAQGIRGVVGHQGLRDTFGSALAAANLGKGSRDDLAIGVPGDNDAKDGGGVNVLFGTDAGLSAKGTEFVFQSSSSHEGDVAGDSEFLDQFGSALAAANFGKGSIADLAVGVPEEDKERFFGLDRTLDVGAANVLYGDDHGLRASDDQFWWQASDSLHDSAGAGDHFGVALAR